MTDATRIAELELLLADARARADLSADERYRELEEATNRAHVKVSKITEAIQAGALAYAAKIAGLEEALDDAREKAAADLAAAYPLLRRRIQNQRRELRRLSRDAEALRVVFRLAQREAKA